MKIRSKLKTLALIPARGGSERLPDKNLRGLGGVPMIGWTVNAALASVFDINVIVSTDSKKIASIASRFGAEVPFIRPAHLSDSKAKTIDVGIHCLEYLQSQNRFYDTLMVLQATSPLRTSKHIDEALCTYNCSTSEALVSVTSLGTNGKNEVTIDNRQMLTDKTLYNLRNGKPATDKPNAELNGAIYIVSTSSIAVEKTFFPDTGCKSYFMEPLDSVDIDHLHEFEVAEARIQAKSL